MSAPAYAAQPEHPSPPPIAPQAKAAASAWNLREISEILADLQQRSPVIYWIDFLLSVSGAWLLAAVFFTAPAWSAVQILSLAGSGILFFRAGTFIHEIAHFPDTEMLWFRRTWNLLLGIPLLSPWILYRNHLEHHSVRLYGTPDDGEYLPLASAPAHETLKYLLQAPLLPGLVIIRFGILGPLSWLHRGLREWVLTAASAGVTNPYYRKRLDPKDESHLIIIEVLCFAYLIGIATLLATHAITVGQFLKGYLLFGFTLTLNWIRNLASHRYGNYGDRMTHTDQFNDSINLTGQTWLTVMLFPVGLRYHALHHLMPTLPYHNLGKAHHRLMTRLPADSPYRAANRNSFFGVAGELWRSALRTAHANSAIHRWRDRSRHA